MASMAGNEVHYTEGKELLYWEREEEGKAKATPTTEKQVEESVRYRSVKQAPARAASPAWSGSHRGQC